MKLSVLLSINLLTCFPRKCRSLSNMGFVKASVPVQVLRSVVKGLSKVRMENKNRGNHGESSREDCAEYPSIINRLKKYYRQGKRISERFDSGNFTGRYNPCDQSGTPNYPELPVDATDIFILSQVASIKKRVAFMGSRFAYA